MKISLVDKAKIVFGGLGQSVYAEKITHRGKYKHR